MRHTVTPMKRRELLALGALAAAAVPAVAAASGAKPEKKKGGGASYLQIQTLTATTIRPDGRRGVLTVEMGLDVPDGKLRALAEMSIPRIRAAFVQSVQTYAAGLPTATAPNADYLAKELQRQTNLVLGKPGARLLLGTILVN